MTPTEDAYADALTSTGSKKITKHMGEEIAGSISGELPSGFPVKVLEMLHSLGGESCGAAHGSGACGCPISTLAILVLPLTE